MIDKEAMRLPCYVMPVLDAPWFVSFKLAYHVGIDKWMHQMPGCKWQKQRAYYRVPIEIAADTIRVIEAVGGYEIKDYRRPPMTAVYVPDWLETVTGFSLRPYQSEDASITAGHDQFIVGHEMGVGKCPIVLTAARMRQVRAGVLVDGPAHRRDWFDPKRPTDCEFGKWWPGHPEIEVLEDGRRAQASEAPIRIVSYQLLHKLRLDVPIDFIWFDEFHMLQNDETYWSKAARRLVEAHPNAWRVGLTGTIQPNEVTNIWNQLDIMWPGRFGTWFDFANAYAVPQTNDYGKTEWVGTNIERAPELARRLQACSVRRTMLDPEVAKWLPDFGVKFSWFPGNASNVMRLFHAVQEAKTLLQEKRKITILTHLRESSQQIADMLKGEVPVVLLTPENTQTPKQRHELRKRAQGMETVALVSTLHSVMQGIDLTFAPNVIYAEMHTRPLAMLQSLKRFHRMSSTEPCSVTILAREGGDTQAETLYNKINALNLVWRAGTAETGLDQALEAARNGGLTQAELDVMLLNDATEQVFDDFS